MQRAGKRCSHEHTLNAHASARKFEIPKVLLHLPRMASQSGASLRQAHGAGGVEMQTQLRLNVAAAFLKLQGCKDQPAKVELCMGVARYMDYRFLAKGRFILTAFSRSNGDS